MFAPQKGARKVQLVYTYVKNYIISCHHLKKKMSGIRSLRNELREFVLENVEVFGEERVLGTAGYYGSVQEVRLEQLDTE